MKNAADFNCVPAIEDHDSNVFLQDVAAYLRGIADATAALSEARPPALEPGGLSSFPVQGRNSSMGSARASRRTMPFGLAGPANDRQERRTVAYLFPQEAGEATASSVDVIPESWGEQGTEERSSGVFLRAKQLSQEWYELVDTAVG
jgi:hypothetical protein